MTQRFATPAAFKASLGQRLRTRAAATGTDHQRLRQLVVFDRFLVRLFETFADAALLKGGLALELRLERARTTKYVDLRLTGAPSAALERLQAAGRLDLGDHLSFEVTANPHYPTIQAEGLAYEGLRLRAEGRLAGRAYGHPFGIDVAFAEPLSAPPEVLDGDDFLAFAGLPRGRFRVYALETHVAEKLHAYPLPRTRPNSRVKDLPDLALLASVRAVHAAALREAITRTFAHRGTHPVPAALPEPPAIWAPVYAELARRDRLPWPDLQAVTAAARAFLDPVLGGEAGTWRPEGRHWS